jgi:NAD(P)-dependent dehydrogenase (short-subunit alcohol dehydrogenase family)
MVGLLKTQGRGFFLPARNFFFRSIVNCVTTNFVRNQAFINSRKLAYSEEVARPNPDFFRTNIGELHQVARTGKPQEVANLVYWRASGHAAIVTGQVSTMGDGRIAKLSLPGKDLDS